MRVLWPVPGYWPRPLDFKHGHQLFYQLILVELDDFGNSWLRFLSGFSPSTDANRARLCRVYC